MGVVAQFPGTDAGGHDEVPPIDPPDGGGDDGDMEARLTALETKWDTVVPTLATKSDMAELRVEIHKMDASIKTWMIATVIALFLGFSGLFFTVTSGLKSGAAAPAAQQAPVIINVPPAQRAKAP